MVKNDPPTNGAKSAGGLPDKDAMPMCKACQKRGCSHFRRGFAHLLSLNKKDCENPSIAAIKSGQTEGPAGDSDILVPSTCPCHGCYDVVMRVDLNRGPEDSLQYTFDPDNNRWNCHVAKYRYKRDTELVIGCAGRHAIIESPKAGRYAQLWCRTCCNCEQTGKKVGKIAGCVDAAHWYTITNRSYHEKTPFHQLVNTLLVASYNDAVTNRIGFEEAIGPVGLSYYGQCLTVTKEAEEAAAEAAAAVAAAQGGSSLAKALGAGPTKTAQGGAAARGSHGQNGTGRAEGPGFGGGEGGLGGGGGFKRVRPEEAQPEIGVQGQELLNILNGGRSGLPPSGSGAGASKIGMGGGAFQPSGALAGPGPAAYGKMRVPSENPAKHRRLAPPAPQPFPHPHQPFPGHGLPPHSASASRAQGREWPGGSALLNSSLLGGLGAGAGFAGGGGGSGSGGGGGGVDPNRGFAALLANENIQQNLKKGSSQYFDLPDILTFGARPKPPNALS